MSTNLTGTFLMSQAAVRQMLAQGNGGCIINILAIQIYSPIANYGAYSASKGGMGTLTRVLAVEPTSQGIRVIGVVAGRVYTPGFSSVLPEDWRSHSEDDLEAVPRELDSAAPTLIGRMGRPSDVARIVAFLASDDAGYMAGSLVEADGGCLLSRKPDPLLGLRRQVKPAN